MRPIHPSAWKGYSPKIAGTEFYEGRLITINTNITHLRVVLSSDEGHHSGCRKSAGRLKEEATRCPRRRGEHACEPPSLLLLLRWCWSGSSTIHTSRPPRIRRRSLRRPPPTRRAGASPISG